MRRLVHIFIFIGVGLLMLYWYIAEHGFSAREKPSKAETWLARNLRGLATPRAALERTNPLQPTPLIIAEGRDHFADHCAQCHANDGSGETELNRGLFPPAPDLRVEATQSLTDGELFYIIENGIRFTGMPGFGGEPEENWKLVHFIRHLPRITREELEFMAELQECGDSAD